jgi:hypothetical protein
MTSLNPIDEIKRIRHELGASVGYDIHRVFEELRSLQITSGRSYVRHHPRSLSDTQVLHGSSGDESTPGTP